MKNIIFDLEKVSIDNFLLHYWNAFSVLELINEREKGFETDKNGFRFDKGMLCQELKDGFYFLNIGHWPFEMKIADLPRLHFIGKAFY